MIQLQYYNSFLKNNHINKILENYKLKYSLVVKEIESKVNEMMKLFLNDILVFLENIEEVAEDKRKINEYEKNKRELDLIRLKMKNKTYTEHKLRNDIDILQQENNILKLKVKSLNDKIFNYEGLNSYNSQNSSPIRKKSSNSIVTKFTNSIPKKINPSSSTKKVRHNNLFIVVNNSSMIEENNNKHSITLISPKSPRKKKNKKDKNSKNSKDSKHKIGTKNSSEKLNKKNIDINKSNKKINVNKLVKFVNNKTSKIVKNTSNNQNNKLIKSYDKKINISSTSGHIKNNKNNFNRNNDNLKLITRTHNSTDVELNNVNNRYSPLNTFNQSIEIPFSSLNLDYDDIGKKINEAIDIELKELERDEANIELLLEQLIDETENDN